MNPEIASSNAPNGSDAKQGFKVTHPFHPLFDKTFDLLHMQLTWGENRVFFLDAAGDLDSMPACWTDIYAADPFVVMAQGRSFFRAKDLDQLVHLIREVKS